MIGALKSVETNFDTFDKKKKKTETNEKINDIEQIAEVQQISHLIEMYVKCFEMLEYGLPLK